MDGQDDLRSHGMHAGMRHAAFTTALVLGTCGGLAQAQEETFQVHARVQRAFDAQSLRDRRPIPDGAVLLTHGAQADSHAFADTLPRTAQHYREAMARDGFRLVFDRGDALAWEDTRQHIEIRLQPVLGTPATTRVVLVATPLPPPFIPRRE